VAKRGEMPSLRVFYIGMDTQRAAKYHCLNCHEYLNDLTNSVLAFVREVQEIAEKIEGEISLKDLGNLYYGGREKNQAG